MEKGRNRREGTGREGIREEDERRRDGRDKEESGERKEKMVHLAGEKPSKTQI